MYDLRHFLSSKPLLAEKTPTGKGGCIQPKTTKFILSYKFYPKELQNQEGVAAYLNCKDGGVNF